MAIKEEIELEEHDQEHSAVKTRIEFYSNTSTSTFRRCKYKYHLSYGKEKIGVATEKGPGLKMGSAGHMAFKAYYSGKSIKTAHDWAYESFAPSNEAEEKKFEVLKTVLKNYWPIAKTDRWKIIEIEKKVEVGRYQGIFDLIITNPNGKIWIVDHKFNRSHSTSHLDVDTQVSYYLLLAQKLGIDAQGLLYNIIPTDGGKDHYPIRKLVSRSPTFLKNFEKDLEAQVQEMDRFYTEPTPYRNFTKDCSYDCEFYFQCLKSMEKK